MQDHRDAAGARILVRHLDIGIGAEPADDGGNQECQGKQAACKFGDLAGERKNPGANHNPGPHGDRACK